jgi:hypothetical protein
MKRLLLLGCLTLLAGCSTTRREPKVSDRDLVPAGWDAKAAGDQVLAGLFKVTGPAIRGAADARFVIVGDRAYVVAAVNEREAGADPHRPFVYAALSIVDLRNDSLLDMMTLARSEQAFVNETLPVGACVAPRIRQVGPKTLRCWFRSEQPGTRMARAYHRDFDLGTLTFADTIQKGRGATPGEDDEDPRHPDMEAALASAACRPEIEGWPTGGRFGGICYLGWQERPPVGGPDRGAFNIDVSRDGKNWERKYRFETSKSFQSPTFVESNGAIWLSVTQGDADPGRQERIMFGRLE